MATTRAAATAETAAPMVISTKVVNDICNYIQRYILKCGGFRRRMESSGDGSPVAGRFGEWRGLRLVKVLEKLAVGREHVRRGARENRAFE